MTINHSIDEHGLARPFEIFINSKNMDHFIWTVALTRMISAIFRISEDSTFVIEELKAVFDPKGGAFHKGKYVPSVLAAIGGIIEEHMISIGYIDIKPDLTAKVEVLLTEEPTIIQVPDPCPKCFGYEFKREAGCEVCLSCGHSKCG